MNDADSQTERANNLEEFIDIMVEKHNFKPTRASVIIQSDGSFAVLKENGKLLPLKEKDIDDIIQGRETVDAEADAIVRAWYPISTYRLMTELVKTHEAWKNEKNPKKKIHYAKYQNSLIQPAFLKSVRMKELEFTYGATGKALEFLYSLKYGFYDVEKIKIGMFTAQIPLNFCHKDELMLRREYPSRDSFGNVENTNGFFEDFRNAFKLISLLKSWYDEDLSVFEKEVLHKSYAKGKDFIQINDNFIAIEGKVGINQNIGTGIKIIFPQEFEKEKFMNALDKNYKNIIKNHALLPKNKESTFHFFMKNVGILGTYMHKNSPELYLTGNVDLLEEVAIPMIYAVVNY